MGSIQIPFFLHLKYSCGFDRPVCFDGFEKFCQRSPSDKDESIFSLSKG